MERLGGLGKSYKVIKKVWRLRQVIEGYREGLEASVVHRRLQGRFGGFNRSKKVIGKIWRLQYVKEGYREGLKGLGRSQKVIGKVWKLIKEISSKVVSQHVSKEVQGKFWRLEYDHKKLQGRVRILDMTYEILRRDFRLWEFTGGHFIGCL